MFKKVYSLHFYTGFPVLIHWVNSPKVNKVFILHTKLRSIKN